MKFLVTLIILVVLATPSYAVYDIQADIEADIATIAQCQAIAQLCGLTMESRENANQYLIEYINQNIPTEKVSEITDLTTEFIVEQVKKLQGTITGEKCNIFAEVWYQQF